jgi:hypothetical protein
MEKEESGVTRGGPALSIRIIKVFGTLINSPHPEKTGRLYSNSPREDPGSNAMASFVTPPLARLPPHPIQSPAKGDQITPLSVFSWSKAGLAAVLVQISHIQGRFQS